MPPSLQIDNTGIMAFDESNAKLTHLTFGATEVTFGNGDGATALRVTNLALPTQSGDAANKQYVDSAILGLKIKEPVRVVSVANVDLSTAVANGSVIDGVTLATGDRVLLAAQTSGVENGIYVVKASGAPDRSADVPAGLGASGLYVFVDQGTVYKDRGFVCASDRTSDVVGTNTLDFIQFSSRASAMAGEGLTLGTAEQLDVHVDQSTLTIINDTVQVKDSGITNTQILDATIANAKLVHPSLTVSTGRGLSGGQLIDLGASATLTPDFAVVPDLAATNTFAAANTFTGAVTISSSTAATSQSTGALIVTGGVGIGGDLYVSSTYNMSDRDLKTDIKVIDNALDVVGAINGCTFTWKDCEANQQTCRAGLRTAGVIAQEVRDAGAPLCVSTHPDTHLMAVDYTKLVPYLIESVKSLKRKCDEIQGELSAVKRAHTA